MMTSTSTNTTTTLQPQQPDLKMMKPPPPPAEMLEQRRRSNSASPSDKILKRSYHHSSTSASSTSGGCPSPLALRPKYLSSNTSSSIGSPSKQVVFADPPVFVTKPEMTSTADSDNNVMASAKRRNLDSGASI